MKAEDVIRIAGSYVGETETPNNSGFNDKVFQKKMEEVGWRKGEAWCCYFAELVFKEAASAQERELLGKLFSGSSTITYKHFQIDGTYKTGQDPRPGCLTIFRHGVSWEGHTVITVGQSDIANNTFPTVEGNTNDKGGREGYIVARKNRYIHKPFDPNGLNLVGHVYLCE